MRPFRLLLLPALLSAQNSSWGTEADFNSRYLWRGIAYSRGPVFQPAFWLTHRGTTVSVWSNMVLNHEPRRGRFDQLVFSLSREYELTRWRLEPTFQGYIWQGLQGDGTARTLELSVKASHPLGPLRFVTSHTLDIASYRGSLISDAGLEGRRLFHRWQFESSATAGWANGAFNRTYTGVDHATVNYLQFTVSATRKSTGGWYVRPHAEFVTTLSGSIRQALGNRALANGGVAFGREF